MNENQNPAAATLAHTIELNEGSIHDLSCLIKELSDEIHTQAKKMITDGKFDALRELITRAQRATSSRDDLIKQNEDYRKFLANM